MPFNSSQVSNSSYNLQCVPSNTSARDLHGAWLPFVVSKGDGSPIRCIPSSTVGFKGQPFCPHDVDGERYVSEVDRCVPTLESCDLGIFGVPGSFENGCDELFRLDDFWGLYSSSCFLDGAISNVYERACCPALEIVAGSQSFTLFKNDPALETVRVY